MKNNTTLDQFTVQVEGPYEPPEGWKWVKLGDVLKEDRRTINPQDYPDEDFWLVTMDCIESDTGRLLKIIKSKGREIKSTKYLFNSDHILYGKLRPYLNKVYVPDGRGICTTEFIPFTSTGAAKKYIAFYLRTKEVVKFAMNNLTGTRQPRVNIDALLEFEVPLPPLKEQKRIVARIEELFIKIEEIKRLRKEALEEAKALMPSALHEVFSKADEKGWKWVRLGEVCKVFSGSSAPQDKQYFENGKYPFVRVQDLGKYGRTTNLIEVNDYINDLAANKFRLVKASEGTILFPKSGAAIMTNSRAILRSDAFIVSHLAAIKPYFNHATPEFVYFWLCQVDMSNYIENPAYPSLKLSTIKEIKIPLPYLEEQKRIVAYLDKIQEKAIALQKLQEETEKEIERLKESILHKAFGGEL